MTTFSSTRGLVATWLLSTLIVTAFAAQGARIFSVRSNTGETPFHSANDRSRWCAVAALGGFGQFEIDPFLEIRDPKTKRRTWYTIDLVRHRGRDGRQHYYSSKPPLLSAIHAVVYAAVRAVTGLSLLTDTFAAARLVLLIVNLLPLAGFWWLWARYWQQRKLSDWAVVVAVTFMLWGTFVSTFANTLNNHLPGALAAGVSLWAVLKIVEEQRRQWRWFILAGAAAAFTAVCELPALAWVAAISVLLVQIEPRRACTGLAIGILPIAIAFAVVNYLAHGDLRPPYAHRTVGEIVTTLQRSDPTADLQIERLAIIEALHDRGYPVTSASVVRTTRTPGVLDIWDEATQYRFALVPEGDQVQVRLWDDWYDYPNSYWYPDRKQGVDRGEPDRLRYLFHATLGHHGILSLTPLWFLVPLGMWAVWQRSAVDTPRQLPRRLLDHRVQLMLAIFATTLVCFVFYMARPLEDRNYGGVSSGFRWMFWFTPLWLWLVAEALDRMEGRWARRLVLLALAASVFSATYPWSNPWTAPWLMQLLEARG